MTRYELFERVGVGGMAEIFRGKAVAAGGFEKPVAIKRILPHLSQDRRFVELLIAEAKILSQLRHRNIVQIFDVGLGDDDQYFLVMEFVDGVDVGAVQRSLETRRKRLPLDLVLHIGAEVCEALEHAHTTSGPDGKPMRLVHRDVSPSNILLSRAGEVKLTDFGIAKRPEEHTGHGAVRGKFAYISPEQAENRHVDARSDVFSLGLVLFELAVGRRLFSQLPDLEALRAVREAKVPRPRELDPRMPADVEDVLLAALAKDPAARIATAGEFGSRLRAIRYGLEQAAGDPAHELTRIVESAAAAKEPAPATVPRRKDDARAEANRTARGKRLRPESVFSTGESTVVRIKTADVFSAPDADGTAILRARQVIDRFEEEETRLSRVNARDWSEERTTGESAAGADPDPTDDGLDEDTRVMGGINRRGAAVDALAVLARGKRTAGAASAAAAAAPRAEVPRPEAPRIDDGNRVRLPGRTDRVAKLDPQDVGVRADGRPVDAPIESRAPDPRGDRTVDVRRGADARNADGGEAKPATRSDPTGLSRAAALAREGRLGAGTVPAADRNAAAERNAGADRTAPVGRVAPADRGGSRPDGAGRPAAMRSAGSAAAREPSTHRRDTRGGLMRRRWIVAVLAGAAIAAIAITAAIVADGGELAAGSAGIDAGTDASAPRGPGTDAAASSGDAAAPRPDARAPDARVPDAQPPDARLPDAPLADGGAPPPPPVVKPPAKKPPVVKPPAKKPPVVKPPAKKPPVVKPPAKKPPVVKPPVKKPAR